MRARCGLWRVLKTVFFAALVVLAVLQLVEEHSQYEQWSGNKAQPVVHHEVGAGDTRGFHPTTNGIRDISSTSSATSQPQSTSTLPRQTSRKIHLGQHASTDGIGSSISSTTTPRSVGEKIAHVHQAEDDFQEEEEEMKALASRPVAQGNWPAQSTQAMAGGVCQPRLVPYTSAGFPEGRPALGIQVCNDQTPDPKRKSAPQIRSYERQLRQTSALLKSIAIFSKVPFHVALVVDTENTFREVLKLFRPWPQHFCERISLSQHFLFYPKRTKFLKHLNRPCSSQRHFFPQTFEHTDLIINMDTDMILMASLEELWAHFDNFGPKQMIGMSAMSYDVAVNHPMFARFPKPTHEGIADGINTGVSLFSLTRWRAQFPNYTEMVVGWHQKYGEDFVFPTQDLFNIFLKEQPQIYYNLPCNWNVRPTLCHTRIREHRNGKAKERGHQICSIINQEGVKALHGAGGHFVSEDAYPWYSLFEAIESYDMSKHKWTALTESLHRAVRKTPRDLFDCSGTFGKHFQKIFLMQSALTAQARELPKLNRG